MTRAETNAERVLRYKSEDKCIACGRKLPEDWELWRCKVCVDKNNKAKRDKYRAKRGAALCWFSKKHPLPEGVVIVKKPRCSSTFELPNKEIVQCTKETGHGGRHNNKHHVWLTTQAIKPEPEREPP